MNEILQEFFGRNTVLVYFVYGLVFFLLGFAIALQSRQHTRLEIARSLKWLAAFGIIHGIHEWEVIIVPFQAMYVNDATMTLFLTLQLVLLVVSYFCLFRFGADLLKDRWPWLIYIPYLIVTFWVVRFFVPSLLNDSWSISWQRAASIWARYLLGFPGAMLAAYGLHYQAKRQIKPLNLPHIYRMFQIAGIALGAYAILTGLVVPPGDFFPANIINSANLVTLIGIPAPVFRSLAGLVITFSVIRGLEVFDVEVDRQFEQMEIERNLVAQRERIGQELHDGAIQQVYTAGLIIESVRNKANDPVLDQRLDSAMSAMNEAIAGLRSYMDNLRAGETPVSLVDGLREQTEDARLTVLMQVKADLILTEKDTMSPVRTGRVLAIVSEALANVARHAQAQQVSVKAQRQQNDFLLTIEDNGRGFNSGANGHGYGLRDMQDHARLLGGELAIESEPGHGTRILLMAPWEEG
jgi:signal transduction histidine kinase